MLFDRITEWLKGMLVDGIMDNLSGMFDAVNQQVADVAAQVGRTPASFSPGVYNLVHGISESVIIPIAGMILTFIACYELIQLIIEHNNLANFETWIFFKWILKTQLARGNNGLTKTKYLTFGIDAESVKDAKPRIEHIQNDLLNNFKQLGVRAEVLNGYQRLKLMHDIFHMGDPGDKFIFDWGWLVESGLSVKDFIAPTAFAFPGSHNFQMGSLHGSMSYLQITASDLSDHLLKDFLDMDSSQIITMHIQSVDQTEAIKTIKHTITELDRSKIEEQKKAVRSGYDMDIIPSDLATYGRDAKAL